VGRRIGACEDTWLPYLVDGEALSRIDAGQGVPLDDYELLEGLLVSWFDEPDGVVIPDRDALFARALDEMVRAFARPSLEVAVLEVARALGSRHGWALARTALRTGRALLPESAQIACDYAIAAWRALEQGADEADAAAHEILDLTPRVDTAALRPVAAEFLAVVEVAALALAHPEGDWRRRTAEVRARVADEYLRRKLDDLLKAPLPLDPAFFDLFESRTAGA
jgi:hypothetical protein